MAGERETNHWYVYILECGDRTLYTGITTELQRRLAQHNAGKASRYTRSRLPVALLYSEITSNRTEAQKREYEIKQLKRHEKLALISGKSASANNI